ncbi:MAG: hypothetical protein KIT84_27815 [Labilithrix sp.]|nr:hypothetical protein [Labilithrix sp.]MCW5814867.1 hypothetical protein [Labilithrix sp.]
MPKGADRKRGTQARTIRHRPERLVAVAALTLLSACGSCANDRNADDRARARAGEDGGRARYFRRDDVGPDSGDGLALRRRPWFRLDGGVLDAVAPAPSIE